MKPGSGSSSPVPSLGQGPKQQSLGPAAEERRTWSGWLALVAFAVFGNVPHDYTFRQRLRHVLLGGTPFSYAWDISQTLLSLVACFAYVVDTYGHPTPVAFDATLTAIFTLDFFLRLYAAPRRVRFVTSFFGAIDILTCLPAYIEWILAAATTQSDLGLRASRIVRIMRLLRIIRAFKMMNSSFDATTRQTVKVCLIVFCTIFLMAGMMNLFEGNDGLYSVMWPEGPTETNPRDFSFLNALYFAVVTIGTIGYGDFVPVTPLGKASCVFFIVISAVIIPIEVTNLAALLARRSKYRGRYVRKSDDVKHVVLIGGTETRESVIKEFLRQFFHPSRQTSSDEMSSTAEVVILGEGNPPEYLIRLMNDIAFDERIKYISGDAIVVEDLERAGVPTADAVFLLSDVMAEDLEVTDCLVNLRTVMSATISPSAKLFVYVQDSAGLESIYGSADRSRLEVMCVKEWKTALLTQSAIIPGFATLLVNLMRASEAEDNEAEPPYITEYRRGSGIEVYTVTTPSELDGQSFAEIARQVYRSSGGAVHVVAVLDDDMRDDTPEATKRARRLTRLRKLQANARTMGAGGNLLDGAVLLNPGSDYRVRGTYSSPELTLEGQVLYVLADDEEAASEAFLPENFPLSTLPPPLSPANRTDNYGFSIVDEKYGHRRAGGSAQVEHVWSWAEAEEKPSDFEHYSFRKSRFGVMASHHDFLRKVIEGQDHPSAPPTPAPGPAAPSTPSPALAAADQFVGVSDAPADKSKLSLASKLIKAASRATVAVVKKEEDAEEIAFSVVGSFTSTAEALRVKRSIFHRLVVDSVASLHPPVSDHVIVCSSLRSFKGFLPHLRALHMRASALQKQVVILTQDADSPEVYEMLIEATRASGVAIVVGTPSNPADLVRAGISQASSLLLMADRDGFAEIDGEVLDVGVVFNYLVLEQVLSSVPTQPNFSLVVELLSMDNLEVLNSKRIDMISEMHETSVAREASLSQTTPVSVEPGVDTKADAPAGSAKNGPASARGALTAKRAAMLLNDGHIAPIASAVRSGHDAEAAWSSLADEDERLLAERRRPHVVDASVVENKIFSLPVYNAGYAFPIDSLPTILVANYFDKNVSKFANELLMPDPGGGGARLILEPVPRRFHARTYGELVNEMLTLYDAVVLGLFRSRLAAGSPLPYVLTAPPARCPLFSTDEEEDCMYVLAHQPLFVGANARSPRELAGMEAMYASVRHIADPDQPREPDSAATGHKRPLVSQISTRKLQAAPEMTATVAAAAATVSELTAGTHLAVAAPLPSSAPAPASPSSPVFVLPSLGSPVISPEAPTAVAGAGSSRDGLEPNEMQLPGVADVHSPAIGRRQSAGVTGLANLQNATFAAVLETRRNSVDRRQSVSLTAQRRASLFGNAPPS